MVYGENANLSIYVIFHYICPVYLLLWSTWYHVSEWDRDILLYIAQPCIIFIALISSIVELWY